MNITITWHGPLAVSDLRNHGIRWDGTPVLYQIYGDHPLFGNETLLYIGKSEKSLISRFFGGGSGHVDKWGDDPRFGRADRWRIRVGVPVADVGNMTALRLMATEIGLIWWHVPPFNAKSIKEHSLPAGARRVHTIANLGSFGRLHPNLDFNALG